MKSQNDVEELVSNVINTKCLPIMIDYEKTKKIIDSYIVYCYYYSLKKRRIYLPALSINDTRVAIVHDLGYGEIIYTSNDRDKKVSLITTLKNEIEKYRGENNND